MATQLETYCSIKFTLLDKMLLLLIAIVVMTRGVQCTINNKQQETLKPFELFRNTSARSPNVTNLADQKYPTSMLNRVSQLGPEIRSSINTTTNKFGRTTNKNEESRTKYQQDLSNQNQTAIDFIIFKDDPSMRHQSKKSSNRLKEHSYNITSSIGGLNEISDPTKQQQRHANPPTNKNLTTADPLEVSDSRRQLARYDSTDYPDDSSGLNNNNADDIDSSVVDDDSYGDGASSNLNEKKVVKELTRMLSKGMSGAADQVRVETLESLKKRSRERKTHKDNRAKLFEDILTAAINNHPDRLRKLKGTKSKSRANSANLKSSASSNSASNNLDLDSDLGSDMETVVQHIQGLTGGNFEGLPGFGGLSSAFSPNDATNPTGEGESDSDSSAQLTEPTNEPSSASDTVNEKQKKQQSQASSDRPIVRQFKKIKNQISQRRKQLDQIKKMFNIELAFNPKDGTLIGKHVQLPSASSTKKRPKASAPVEVEQTDDYADESDNLPNKRTRPSSASGRNDKARELLAYLRDNPEILASVMAELTVDADPTNDNSRSQSSYGRGSGESVGSSQSPSESDEILLGNLKSKSSAYKYPADYYQNQRQLPVDIDDMLGVFRSKRARRTGTDRTVRVVSDLESLLANIKRGRANNPSNHLSSNTIQASKSRPTAEELLLESLRERQLLNLARLDLVMAERAASNKSMSATLSALQGSLDGMASPKPWIQYDPLESSRRTSNEDFNRTLASHHSNLNVSALAGNRMDEELAAHFMAIRGGQSLTSSDQIAIKQSNINDYLGSTGSSSGLQTQHMQPQQNLPMHQQLQMLQKQLATSSKMGTSPVNTMNGVLGFGPGNFSSSQPQQQQLQQHHHQQQYQSLLRANENNQPQPPQQVPTSNTLKRFRDWRDVGQDASSWQFNRASSPLNINGSLSPYDLNTGSSLASSMGVESIAKLPVVSGKSDDSSTEINQPAELQNNSQTAEQPSLSSNNEHILNSHQQGIGHIKPAGSQFHQNQPQRDQLIQTNFQNFLPATRLGFSEPDLSTVKLSMFAEKERERQQANRPQNIQQSRPPSVREETSTGLQREDYHGGRNSMMEDESDDNAGRGNYFRSYKDDELPNYRRSTRPRLGQHKKHEAYQSLDMGVDSDMDDAGAMWA
jgi:hypothetical protein